MVDFNMINLGDINVGQLTDALMISFLYIVFSWMLWKRTSKKLTFWFEVLFRVLFPVGIVVSEIYFSQNYFILLLLGVAVLFYKMTHAGKLLLKENLHSLDFHLTIINEASELPEYEETEIFENLAKKTYDVADVMTKNAMRLGEDFYKQCEPIITSLEGVDIHVYYTWMLYNNKMEYLKFLYLHKHDPQFNIPPNLSMNCVELEPEWEWDRSFRVFFALGGDRNENMLEYLKKWKRVYETAKIVPIYDDYVDLQDEVAELRERYVNRRKRASDFKHFIKGEEKEEGG